MTLDPVLAAVARQFDPDRPAHSWYCFIHRLDCPRDSPRWRTFYADVVEKLQELQSWRPEESFADWLGRETRGCRAASEKEQQQREIDAIAAEEAMERLIAEWRSEGWLDPKTPPETVPVGNEGAPTHG